MFTNIVKYIKNNLFNVTILNSICFNNYTYISCIKLQNLATIYFQFNNIKIYVLCATA